MKQHTGLPWVANDQHSGNNPWRIESDAEGYPNDGWIIAELHGSDAKANAAFIVTACNAHDELAEALLIAKCFVEDALEDPHYKKQHVKKQLSKINAALAKARVKP